jgi:lycopene cyclase CruP
LVNWSWHYFNLALYSGLYSAAKLVQPIAKNLPPNKQYYYHRWLDAWKYGSGGDYEKD